MYDLSNKTDERLLRLKHVLEIIPVSKSSWWAGVKEGKYPASVKCGSSTFWRFSDISTLVNQISSGTFVPQKTEALNTLKPVSVGSSQ